MTKLEKAKHRLYMCQQRFAELHQGHGPFHPAMRPRQHRAWVALIEAQRRYSELYQREVIKE